MNVVMVMVRSAVRVNKCSDLDWRVEKPLGESRSQPGKRTTRGRGKSV